MIRGLMGEREVASAPFLSVVKSSHPAMSNDPALLIDVRSMALSAPRLMDALNLQPFRPPALFQLEQDLVQKYQARLSALEQQEKLKADLKAASSESIRSSKKFELDQAHQEEMRKLKERADRENEEAAKIQQIVNSTAVKDPKEARFYLESQNWDVRATIGFITQAAPQTTREIVNVHFRLPTGDSFTETFGADDSMWGLLTVVFRKLQEKRIKRPFKLVVKGSVLSEEAMSRLKFAEAGIRGSYQVDVAWNN